MGHCDKQCLFFNEVIFMNEKARVFEEFLIEEKITCFEKREVGDEDHTVVFRSYVQTELGDIPVFLLLDDTIYATIRFLIGAGVVTKENRPDILTFINRENSTYKSFKYYIEEDDDSVYLDCINQSANSHFDPRLLYVLMSQIVEYIPGKIETIGNVFGVEQLPPPEHTHE